MPSLPQAGKDKLLSILQEETERMPGLSLAIASADEVLFHAEVGKVDFLDNSEAAEQIKEDTIGWFASTTKLLTSIAALKLVDQGVLSLDTPVAKYLPQLASPGLKYISSVDPASGKPVYKETDVVITLLMLMNQTAGFGEEFGPKVTAWKKHSPVGKGFVNSCKIENLVNTPLCNVPGTVWEYGNGHEWLGLLVQEASGKPLEIFLQENLFKPLGMNSTTFFPFADEEKKRRLMPLRWREERDDGSAEWQVLTDQQPGLTLPRTREEIEYPVGGGGIYSTSLDYVKVLQHLLHAHTTGVPSPILSPSSIESIFKGTLPPGAFDRDGNEGILNLLKVDRGKGEVDWSTAVAVYLREGQKGGWGRFTGSVGWAGAGGTEYWIDPKSGVACVLTTNMLPARSPVIAEMKERLERAIYEELVL